jgi:hypothetical protein
MTALECALGLLRQTYDWRKLISILNLELNLRTVVMGGATYFTLESPGRRARKLQCGANACIVEFECK